MFEYLRFIYKINGIGTKEDLQKLTPKQVSYQTRFIDVLDTVKQHDECGIRRHIGNVKTRNDKKKAQKYGGRISTIMQGKPQSGKYVLRMKQ